MITQEQIRDLQERVKKLEGCLEIAAKRREVAAKTEETLAADFWNDPKAAEAFLKKLAGIKSWVTGFDKAREQADDLDVLYDFAKDSISGADEEAMETLTVEDMDTYSMISERIATEDVFTIVDSYFMPNGNECDQYSLMGEILEVESVKNSLTGEDVFLMSLDCNDVVFEICINHQDLLGEPEIGRRFKGIIQLQGRLSDKVS